MPGRSQSPVRPVILLVAMALYFIGAPATSIILGSWWPLVIYTGGLLGVVCLLMAVGVVIDARRPPTLAEKFAETIIEGLTPTSGERCDAGDLPRPVGRDNDHT